MSLSAVAISSKAEPVRPQDTTILSSAKTRSAHATADRCLAGLDVTRYDIASDEDAKQRWKKLNKGNTELPLIIVDGERPGSIDDLQEACVSTTSSESRTDSGFAVRSLES